MNSLLTLERIVLESIARGCKFESQITLDTGLHFSIVKSLCSKVIKKGLVVREHDGFRILDNEVSWKRINSKENLQFEVEEISQEIVNSYFKKNGVLKLQKVYLSKGDEKILNSMFKNIEVYIKNLQKDEKSFKKNPYTKDRKVIMWGHCRYGNLVECISSAS